MIHVLLGAAGLAVVLGQSLLVRYARRGQGSAPLILSAMPLALLMLVTPIPLVALWTIDAFRTLGQTGTATLIDAGRLARGMLDPLWWGAVGFLVAICAAAVLQRSETQRVDAALAESPVEPAAGRWWASALPVASVVLIIPAAFLFFRQAELATFVMEAGGALRNHGPTSVAGLPLEEFSQMMSARLIVGTLGGFALLAVVLMSAVINIVSFRSSSHSEGLLMVSRGVFILAGVLGLWTVYVLTATASTFTRVME